jgi:hypothetical protein
VIRLGLERALLLLPPALAALGCAGAAPLPVASAPREMVAAATITPAPIVAAATIIPAPIVAAATTTAPIPSSAFPAGWVRGAPAPLDPAPPLASLTLGPQRPPVAPVALRLADLPLVEVTPRPVDTQRPGPNVAAPGEPSREIFIAPGCSRVSVRNHSVGEITVGWFSLPIAPQSGGGVQIQQGGDGHDRYTLASWRTLDRAPGGALLYRETHAWFDMITCKAFEVRHVEVLAQPIASGLGYAFRTRCPSCKVTEIDALHLITPGSGWDSSAFEHSEIALGQGRSTTRLMTFGNTSIRRFRESGSITSRVADATLGVDVVQGSGESEPTAMIYVSDPPPSRF